MYLEPKGSGRGALSVSPGVVKGRIDGLGSGISGENYFNDGASFCGWICPEGNGLLPADVSSWGM
jgi:hypothetical protein